MPTAEPGSSPWWRDAVTYQVYVRSFADSNGDGIGDLAGVRSQLDYIRGLGVDAIWLNPFYPSPQVDAGYDVSDYRDVDPVFGTLDDFDALVADAHARGLRVIVDLVPNHTSSEHPWFRQALEAEPGSGARDRYIFHQGRGNGDEPPNDWQSVFGGPAWTRVKDPDGRPGEWYLHLFAPEQPDLNWANEEVRAEFESVLRFWLDRGVDGFRIDVAHGLVKDPELPDLEGRFATAGPAAEGHPHWDQHGVHDVYRSWRRVVDAYTGDRVFVAEAWVAEPVQLARYLRADELHTAFNFGFLLAPWDPVSLRRAIDHSIEALADTGTRPTWVLSNHDVTRVATRLGDGPQGTRLARAAALLMLALPGGAYVYQGEELGLPEVVDLPDEARQDPAFFRTHGEQIGRDGCRIPLPWRGDAPPYGFTTGTSTWLPQPRDWALATVQQQEREPASTLTLFRAALAIRRAHDALGDGEMRWLDAAPDVLAFVRDPGFACVVNLGSRDVEAPAAVRGASVLLTSVPGIDGATVPAGTAVWYTEVARGRRGE